MGQPAARLTDMHVCPMWDGPVPHVGGPVVAPGCPTVLIGGLPAARVTDMAVCCGPPDMIAEGSPTVFIGGLMAARMGDMTVHGGVIVVGDPTVLIGDGGAGGAPSVGAPASGFSFDVEGFLQGLGEGALDAVEGMLTGLGDLAVGSYEFAMDDQYRQDTMDALGRLSEKIGSGLDEAFNNPGQAISDLSDTAGRAWGRLTDAYHQAAAQGKGSEFIGKVSGQIAVLVGTALVGGAEADGVGLAGDSGRAADFASDVAGGTKLTTEAGDVVRIERTTEEFDALAEDPAHGGKITRASEQERNVALDLEARGDVPGPIRRSPTEGADFIDGNNQQWDVKGFNSKFPPNKGGFDLATDAGKVDKELAAGENVMLDTSKMSESDIDALRAEGQVRGWGDRVKWWP